MDFEKFKNFFTLLLTAFGIFILIFLMYSIFLINRYARKRQEVKTGFAEEKITATPVLIK